MTILAMIRTARIGRARYTASDVLPVSHGFEMIRIDTPTITTKMIDFKANRNRSVTQFVCNTVSPNAFAFYLQLAIATVIERCKPFPTAVWENLYFRVKSIG
jgi:hypothetical protein